MTTRQSRVRRHPARNSDRGAGNSRPGRPQLGDPALEALPGQAPAIVARRGAERLLHAHYYGDSAAAFAEAWARGDADAIAEVKALLKREQLDDEAIAAHILITCISEIERFAHLISQAEVRVRAAMREIERQRDVLARLPSDDGEVRIEEARFIEAPAAGPLAP